MHIFKPHPASLAWLGVCAAWLLFLPAFAYLLSRSTIRRIYRHLIRDFPDDGDPRYGDAPTDEADSAEERSAAQRKNNNRQKTRSGDHRADGFRAQGTQVGPIDIDAETDSGLGLKSGRRRVNWQVSIERMPQRQGSVGTEEGKHLSGEIETMHEPCMIL
jgi:hypothetical protein